MSVDFASVKVVHYRILLTYLYTALFC